VKLHESREAATAALHDSTYCIVEWSVQSRQAAENESALV